MELFRVRLNCVDHYQAQVTPYDPQLRRDVSPSQPQNDLKVPVIRVFGSTETGQKVCAHIHGAFPYLYVRYAGSLHPEDVRAYIHQLHQAVNRALCVSFRKNVYDEKNQYVARITLVKGIPFYGYHVGYQYFLKIYLLDPMVMTRLVDLLHEGFVMKQVFQPYESHLQYILQWMVDYNLYGCDYINCERVYFRRPVPKYDELKSLFHLWHDRSIPEEYILRENILPRVSHCSIEVDICVRDIINRKEIKVRALHHDFIERLRPLAPDEKLVHSMAALWRDETRRRKSRMVDPDPGSSPFPPEVMMSMSATSRSSQEGAWIHDEEYRQRINGLIAEERSKSNASDLSFDTFVRTAEFGDSVKTALEAVEDLYPEVLGPTLGFNLGDYAEKATVGARKKDSEVDVNQMNSFNSSGSYGEFPSELEEEIEEILRTADVPEEVKHDDVESFQDNAADNSKHISRDSTSNRIDIKHSISHFPDDNHHTKRQKFEQQMVSLRNAATMGTVPPRKNKIRQSMPTGFSKPVDELETKYTSNSKLLAPSAMPSTDWPLHFWPITESERSVAPNNPKFRNKTAMKPLGNLKSPNEAAVKPLGIPIIKDMQEPSTILRIDQGSLPQKSSTTITNTPTSWELPIRSPQERNSTTSAQNASSDPGMSLHTKSISKIPENITALQPPSVDSRPFSYSEMHPATEDISSTMHEFDLPAMIYPEPFYSVEADVPNHSEKWAGRKLERRSRTVPILPNSYPFGLSPVAIGRRASRIRDWSKEETPFGKRRQSSKILSWELAEPSPTYEEVEDWLKKETVSTANCERLGLTKKVVSQNLSQIDGPTQKYEPGFNYTQQIRITSVQQEVQYMSTMSLEIHVNTRGALVPNPEEDEVRCIFWCVQMDDEDYDKTSVTTKGRVGIVVAADDDKLAPKMRREMPVEISEENSELDLLVRMVEIVRMYDPDILTGYDVQCGSWGYLIERARLKYDYNLCDEFSRMKSQSHGRFGKENDRWGFENTSSIRVTGRHMINIWRAMRSELSLSQYSMENVAFHLLHRRIPHYSWHDLTSWYTNGKSRDLAKVLRYYVSRVQGNLEILERNDLIPRTSEQARLLGVDFFSVISRGSQFKVESLMFRIAKPENFILISPSRKQVGLQNALECLPLVMEPRSAFYNSPLLVLDFQSLYPSIMIAYNYCYSTFLGRIIDWRGTNKMGFTVYKRQKRLLELLQDYINIAPNGMMYVKPTIRKSLLAKMLGEILETRVMVKSSMKTDKDDEILQKLLNNRQLALKLIANVTYGYTSASFSGRMPCTEIADSIVQTARETLEKSIALIHSIKRWDAEVVYGDTDSLFIYLNGRTKDQAFDIGNEIVKVVTSIQPHPVRLKFEKVYLPSVLIAKKRYVGFKYENRDQESPEFDAKGIETVRRDGTPAEQKIEEKALKILFQTADLSQIKQYFQEQCEKIMKGSISIQDFFFAKEVKLDIYSGKGPPPPGALISTRRMLEDPRSEPQYGERVPYVVVTGPPGARLIDRCVAPETLLKNGHLALDSEYYICKNLIPPLERIFNLVGANVRDWYDEMPKFKPLRRIDPGQSSIPKEMLEFYLESWSCVMCRVKLKSNKPLCSKCLNNTIDSLRGLHTRLNRVENRYRDLEEVCRSCSGISPLEQVKCDSKDCPVFYSRTKQGSLLRVEEATIRPALKVLEDKCNAAANLDW